ncbi:MAG: hypothetical protein KZQ78_16230, partial [Candidatus Thiodiazotropha sp. (ex Ustalcina ferruginea)]|nr:hypothetical protein [Candidatus Thiodiazotropha sp. (ex Ustalcina ferruginea)]
NSLKSLRMVTFLQRTFTSLVHTHAGRTQRKLNLQFKATHHDNPANHQLPSPLFCLSISTPEHDCHIAERDLDLSG